MIAVTTISYRFNINGHHSNILQAKCGLTQRDPMSPLLFVIIMECLNKILHDMKENHDFNHHAKCEKLNLTNLTFVDDLLLFARGDYGSVELMLTAFNNFSITIDLKINTSKCRIYFGGVDLNTKRAIMKLSGFKKDPPF